MYLAIRIDTDQRIHGKGPMRGHDTPTRTPSEPFLAITTRPYERYESISKQRKDGKEKQKEKQKERKKRL